MIIKVKNNILKQVHVWIKIYKFKFGLNLSLQTEFVKVLI